MSGFHFQLFFFLRDQRWKLDRDNRLGFFSCSFRDSTFLPPVRRFEGFSGLSIVRTCSNWCILKSNDLMESENMFDDHQWFYWF